MELPISIDLLRTLALYAEHGNVVEVARILGLSQPAVSGHLQRLEGLLPQPIFLSQGRRKALTPFGIALAAGINGPLSAIDRSVERVLQQYGSPELLTLRVGCRQELLGRIAPRLNFPGTIVFLPCSTAEVLKKLERFEIDLGITHTKPDSPDLVAKRLFEEGSVLIVREDLLATLPDRYERWQDFADASFLRALPAVVYKSDAPLLRPLVEKAGLNMTQIKKRMICEDWATIVRLVEQGHGYSVVPGSFVDAPVTSGVGLRTVKLPPSVSPPIVFFALMTKALLEIPTYRHSLGGAL